ncbi:MAG: hypothetical protein ACI8X5_004107 [Planctomycetota bacterium]
MSTVDDLPATLGDPISSIVRQVFVRGKEGPLQTRSELALDIRVARDGDKLPDAIWQETRLEALWPGTAIRWNADGSTTEESSTQDKWEEVGLHVSRSNDGNDGLMLGLILEGWVSGPDMEKTHLRENLVLESPASQSGEQYRFLVSTPTPQSPLAGKILELRIHRTPEASDEFLAATERGRASLDASLELARASSEVFQVESEFGLERVRAIEAMETVELRRPALLFLSAATDAECTNGLILIADNESIASYLDCVQQRLEQSPAEQDVAGQFGWLLEQSTYHWLALLSADPEQEIPDEFASLLVRNAGELGRYPDLVLEAVLTSSDQSELAERFVQENLIFLNDNHPAARLRAHDWLSAMGKATPGYDPLGPRDERRDALAASQEDQQ